MKTSLMIILGLLSAVAFADSSGPPSWGPCGNGQDWPFGEPPGVTIGLTNYDATPVTVDLVDNGIVIASGQHVYSIERGSPGDTTTEVGPISPQCQNVTSCTLNQGDTFVVSGCGIDFTVNGDDIGGCSVAGYGTYGGLFSAGEDTFYVMGCDSGNQVLRLQWSGGHNAMFCVGTDAAGNCKGPTTNR